MELLTDFSCAMYSADTSAPPLPYRVLWPTDYESTPNQRFPLVLFLHGAGERGSDNQLQLTHGASFWLDSRADFPAIILIPQCAENDYWAQMVKTTDGRRAYNFDETPNPSLAAVRQLLHHFIANERIDPNRVYLMGLSMGGMGTFELLAREPDTFAAAVPICGGTNPKLARLYAEQVPLWIFHGEDDETVDVENSRRIVQELTRLGYPPLYKEYPGIGHESWNRVFAEPGLLSWLFAQTRSKGLTPK